MREKDPARVSEFVDFVLLRDSVKELLTWKMVAINGTLLDKPGAD